MNQSLKTVLVAALVAAVAIAISVLAGMFVISLAAPIPAAHWAVLKFFMVLIGAALFLLAWPIVGPRFDVMNTPRVKTIVRTVVAIVVVLALINVIYSVVSFSQEMVAQAENLHDQAQSVRAEGRASMVDVVKEAVPGSEGGSLSTKGTLYSSAVGGLIYNVGATVRMVYACDETLVCAPTTRRSFYDGSVIVKKDGDAFDIYLLPVASAKARGLAFASRKEVADRHDSVVWQRAVEMQQEVQEAADELASRTDELRSLSFLAAIGRTLSGELPNDIAGAILEVTRMGVKISRGSRLVMALGNATGVVPGSREKVMAARIVRVDYTMNCDRLWMWPESALEEQFGTSNGWVFVRTDDARIICDLGGNIANIRGNQDANDIAFAQELVAQGDDRDATALAKFLEDSRKRDGGAS